jgi:hypothetical protein
VVVPEDVVEEIGEGKIGGCSIIDLGQQSKSTGPELRITV